MGSEKGDTMVWCRVTRHPRVFRGLTGCQRDPRDRGVSVDMRWHKEKRLHEDGVLRHLTDSKVWKDFDNQYPWFAQDARNVRLALATDGFNPFGTMSNKYSMWHVVHVPYNMPPWKCMKEIFFMMTLLM